MNRGRVIPRPQDGFVFGVPGIQQRALVAVTADLTTPGALIGCTGAPRTAVIVIPYQAAPWLAAVGA